MAQAALICRGVAALSGTGIGGDRSRNHLASVKHVSSLFLSSSPSTIATGSTRLSSSAGKTFALFGSKPAAKPKTTSGKVSPC
jgi:hypothetical protein